MIRRFIKNKCIQDYKFLSIIIVENITMNRTTLVNFKRGTFFPFLILVVLRLAPPKNYIFSEVTRSKYILL